VQANKRLKRVVETPDVTDLEYLRQGTIGELVPVLLVFGWLAGLRALRFGGRFDTWPVAAVLIGGALGALLLRRVNVRAARYWLVVSLIGGTAFEAWSFPGGPVRYYFPVCVVMSSLLVSHSSVFAVATLAAAAYALVARRHGVGWSDMDLLISPLVLIALTAFASWLGSRQLHMALEWMQNSYARARETLDQLREQRATLARTLKALEEAYTRIEKMNYALVEARNAAEEARRIKAEFAANISHELRTPLNLIIGFSETMANAPETYGDVAWSPSLRGDVDQIYRSSCHLASLIDDILDLSALDARRFGLTLEDVDVGALIAEVVSVMEALFHAKGLYLRVDLSPDLQRVRLDPTRIRQVLLNLLNNASRFTRQGGVTISAHQRDREIQVAVTDTGVGIAPQDVPKVFEEFRQVDGSPHRNHDGTGLGIPLSKRLVELHGGRMWLESAPGQGTTFYFTLPTVVGTPLAVAQQSEGVPATPPTRPAHRRSVLAAQPGPLLLHTLRRHIDGYDVVGVPQRAALPDLIDKHQPVALIVDSQGESTFASVEGWSSDVPTDLPVVGFPQRDSLGSARALGVRDYLIKPVTRQRLLDAVDRLGGDVHNVLIVDDDPRLVELLGRMLESAGPGYRPIKTFGGEDALARMRRDRPDLVLLDLIMPEVDGLAVLKAMRADPSLVDVPVILVSAHEYPEIEQVEGGHTLGLVRRKGFTTAEMLHCLQALLDALPLRVPSCSATAPACPTVLDG